jgi:hypothetical protein
MTTVNFSPMDYVERLKGSLSECSVIEQGQRDAAIKRNEDGTIWLVGRGEKVDGSVFVGADPEFGDPYPLKADGYLHLFVKVEGEQMRVPPARITEYRFTLLSLKHNENGIESVRCDGDGRPNPRQGDGWDHDLADNPFHARFHVHINFHRPWPANEMRLPVGFVNPIMIIKFFDDWYSNLPV